jgi:thiol:disulfide interchange protein DsbD
MKIKALFSLAVFLLLASVNFAQLFDGEKQVITVDVLQSYDKVHPGTELKIAFKLNIEDGWHINSNKPNEDYLIGASLEMQSLDGLNLTDIVYPEGRDINFAFSKIPVSIYEKEALVKASINVPESIKPGEYKVKVIVNYQACNNASCLAPASFEKEFAIQVVEESVPINSMNQDLFSETTLEFIITLLGVFLGGLALNLTPCVYPLIPITIGYFGGQSEGSSKRLFALGLLYVLGMALTYSVVGVVTALSGAVFGSLMQNMWVIIGIALVFIVLSLSMFGVYEFKLPDALVMKAGGAKGGLYGAFFMGLTMGIVAAPCIGPFVLGLVTLVGAKGDPFYGFIMFFSLAVGLGLPYLFLAIFSGKIKSLPRAGVWMEGVKHIFGFILLGMAFYFIAPLLPKEVNYYLLPAFIIVAALYLLIIDKMGNNIKGFFIFKTAFSILMIALAGYMLVPSEKESIAWEKFEYASYEESLGSNKKMIIDFYADWCIPCKELDALTFSDPNIIAMTKDFDSYKVDMTKSISDETDALRKRFDIKGMPTVLIIDSNGKEAARITGFVDAKEFATIINKIN